MKKKQCACCGQRTLPAESDYDICPVCGWEDDDIQNKYPDLRGGANFISLNEEKKAIAEGKTVYNANKEAKLQAKLAEEARAKSPVLYDCPCCGNRTLHWHGDVCDLCHWTDDPSQSVDPDKIDGENLVSLNAARAAWAQGIDTIELMLATC